MLRLYYAPRTRAGRVRWTLEELGVPYELKYVDLAGGESRQPEYLKINPLGVVPALQDGEKVMLESIAICLYLADRFPKGGLAPRLDDRADYYQWCLFMSATLEPQLVRYVHHTRLYPEDRRSAVEAAEAQDHIIRALHMAEVHIYHQKFVTGQFSVADILLGGALNWIESLGLLANYQGLREYTAFLKSRPAYQRSIAD